jgi:hypothetical protein
LSVKVHTHPRDNLKGAGLGRRAAAHAGIRCSWSTILFMKCKCSAGIGSLKVKRDARQGVGERVM